MAYNLVAMASNLLARNLIGMASNLIAMASNLLAVASSPFFVPREFFLKHTGLSDQRRPVVDPAWADEDDSRSQVDAPTLVQGDAHANGWWVLRVLSFQGSGFFFL